MIIFIFLLIIEVLTVIVLKDILSGRSKVIFRISLIINFIFSFLLWWLLIGNVTYNSFYDNPGHINMMMNFEGTVCAVVIPRVIFIIFHFTGKLFRLRRGGYVRWLTNSGLTISLLMFAVLAISDFYSRSNFKIEYVEIKIKELNNDLVGLKIVQLSDMHLSSFYGHEKSLARVMDMVNALEPDLILNTGDFVTFGWREFDSNDTILAKAKSRYGNFAVMGNHDFGNYHPYYTEADRDNNVLIINNKIRLSGYTVLNDTNVTVKVKNAKIGMIGIITKGRHPIIIHGDLKRALSGMDSVDLKILLSHDPNQWETDVVAKNDIDLTLSGHSHGMQIGITTKKFRWSPAKFIYPHWNGIYTEGKQVQYVNRGLGELSIPFRIWMPPEITLITLKRE
jgi:predicted MPP superfamily phosphohydrolase